MKWIYETRSCFGPELNWLEGLGEHPRSWKCLYWWHGIFLLIQALWLFMCVITSIEIYNYIFNDFIHSANHKKFWFKSHTFRSNVHWHVIEQSCSSLSLTQVQTCDTTWRHPPWPTWVRVMACCFSTPMNYSNTNIRLRYKHQWNLNQILKPLTKINRKCRLHGICFLFGQWCVKYVLFQNAACFRMKD